MKLATLDRLREGAAVKRWHTARTIRDQSVGEHSHGVAMILLAIDGSHLLQAALTHDLHEIETGDIPATTKWRHPILARDLATIEAQFEERHGIEVLHLSRYDRQLLKWADMLELVLWANEEVQMGNQFMDVVRDRGLKYLVDMGSPNVAAANLLEEFITENIEEDLSYEYQQGE